MTAGAKIWVFPDGDLPPQDPLDPALKNRETHGHESLVVLNTGDSATRLTLTVFFADAEPWVLDLPDLPARRVVCHRTDEPLGAERRQIQPGQYALVLASELPVVAQLGRMDIRQPNLAYYTVMGYAADGI